MNLSALSIKRPVFITCVLLMIIVLGLFSFAKLPVDLFPEVTFPVVTVSTAYPGAGPKEVELLVSKPLEEEIGTISGLKTIRSINREGMSVVVAEFTLETDVKYAEQQVRDRTSSTRSKLPDDIKEPTIRRIDPADQPIMILSLYADLPMAQHYDMAKELVKPRLEQIKQVGLVDVMGGRKREIHVEVDRNNLNRFNVSLSQISDALAMTGQNIPAGSVARETSGQDMVFRTVGEFETVRAVKDASVSFLGNDRALTLSQMGTVRDTLEDATMYSFINGQPTLLLYVYKQSGANTVAVSDAVKKALVKINADLAAQYKDAKPELRMVSNQARYISLNVADVQESIGIGILLTILVVYFFLGSMRSTLITGVAIPVSLIGAAALMMLAGFSINIMSLLAFSLAVGLLIDDAIVVRENIFRHIEMGKGPRRAALEGTMEVTMAVIAVSLTIIAVFAPIGFLSGVIGQFFKQFGLTVCFIMLFSLFDALTNAPMMSAYFGGGHPKEPTGGFMYYVRTPVRMFNRMQDALEHAYAAFLRTVLRRPWIALAVTGLVVVSSVVPLSRVPKTFLPTQDSGEFSVGLDMAPGTSLEKMRDQALEIDKVIRESGEVVNSVLTVGTKTLEKNKAEFYVFLKPFGERSMSTSDYKDKMRELLKPFTAANPKVKDIDYVGGGMRPFTLNLVGQDLDKVNEFSQKVMAKLAHHPALLDVDTSYRPGKPEYQVKVDLNAAQRLGVSSSAVGRELRAQVEGETPAVFRENGLEYDIRVRLKPEQRDLQPAFNQILVPNMNRRLVDLNQVAKPLAITGPASIDRENRGRYVQISADLAPKGPGMGGVIADLNTMFAPGGELELPPGISYRFVGQAENFQELVTSMALAALLGLIFIYLVLSSLYESFFTPLTIMMVIPLAAIGAFFALWLGGKSLDLYSMIGCIMLMGLATKNSIILIDYINQLIEQGKPRLDAIVEAGKVRLRPILMTSFALIAGMVPVAVGLNEVSNQRTSLGVAVIGGVLSSTLLTLIVIPAVFSYMEILRSWLLRFGSKLVTKDPETALAKNGKYSHPDSFAGNPDGNPPQSRSV
ncbi:MAG: efflux RND transporter permease subunit [Bdellovibrionales bacterium]|nr:efflux RND transporter permease subunit [Bdellovibrionales bacterium]